VTDDPLGPLRARFQARAAIEATALAEALAGGEAVEVERIAHGLAGAAGLFGFADVGAAAIAVDQDFAAGRPIDTAKVKRLIETLQALA
jgi:HPt (histidine-containing phosphotransfer) domain-containing protein